MSYESPTPPASSPWLVRPDVPESAAPTVELAGVGQRIVGRLLSGAVLSVALLVPYVAGLVVYVRVGGVLGLALVAAGPCLYLVLAITQIAAMGRRGANQCRKLADVRILDAQTLRPAGFGRVLLRELVLGAIGGLTLGIGTVVNLIVLASRGDRRGWHDRAAGTLVLRASTVPVELFRQPVRSATHGAIEPVSSPTDTPVPATVAGLPEEEIPPVAAPVPPTPVVARTDAGSGLIAQVPGLPPAAVVDSHAPPDSSASIIGEHAAVSPRAQQTVVRRAVSGRRVVADDGRSVPLEERVIIGRDPSDPDGTSAAALMAVDDPDRSMSKTHAAFTFDRGCFVEDLGSINGVAVESNGVRRELPPFVRTQIASDDIVHLGDRAFTIEGV